MCIAGNARTFPDPKVQGNLSEFLGYLRQNESAVLDVFAYMTLSGSRPKDQRGWEFIEIDSSQKEIEAALGRVHAKDYELVQQAEEVTPENLFAYATDLQCLRQGVWIFPRNLIRSLNQLVHLQRCLLMVVKEELKANQRYDAVLITRPDLMFFTKKIVKPIIPTAISGNVVHMWDWFFAMKREVMNKLLDPKRAVPLQCRSSEWCCKKLGRSEDMFEYILRAPMSARCGWRQYLCNHTYAFQYGSEELEPGVAGDVLRIEPGALAADSSRGVA